MAFWDEMHYANAYDRLDCVRRGRACPLVSGYASCCDLASVALNAIDACLAMIFYHEMIFGLSMNACRGTVDVRGIVSDRETCVDLYRLNFPVCEFLWIFPVNSSRCALAMDLLQLEP